MAADNSYWNSKDEMHIHMDTVLPEPLRLRHSKAKEDLNISEVFNYANDSSIEHFRYTPDDVNGQDASSFRRTLQALQWLIADKRSEPRFLDKSQSYTVKVGYLNSLLLGCEPMFLVISRNPLAICAREALKVRESGKSVAAFEKRLREVSSHWKNSFDYALDDAVKYNLTDRFKTVQFEEVLADPERVVGGICKFLGLNYSDAILPGENDTFYFPHTKDKKWYPIRRAANEKYIQQLSDSQIQIILDRCGDTMLRLGYSVAEI